MKDELISIIVPVYNVEEYIDICMDSLVNQTYKNIEIILVDDGSLDSSPSICDKWENTDNRVKVIHKKNGGLSDARNAGLELISGKYVGFIDPDDYIDLNFFEILYKDIRENNAEIAIGGMSRVYGDKIEPEESRNIKSVYTVGDAIDKMNSFGYFGVSVCDKLFKSNLFKRNKFLKGKKAEDMFITYDLFMSSKVITYNNSVNYYYIQREGSISHELDENISHDFIEATKHVIDIVNKNYPEHVRGAYTRYIYACIGVYDKYILSSRKKEAMKIYKLIKESYKKIDSSSLKGKRLIQLKLIISAPFIYDIVFKMYYKNKNNK